MTRFRLPRALSPVDDSDSYAHWDAAYVLGSLSNADRREFEAHLSSCPSCRESVGELGGMPALLGQLTLEEVARIDDRESEAVPPLSPRVLTALQAEVSRSRRNSRLATWTLGAAAAAAIGIGVLLGVQFYSGAPDSAPPRNNASALSMTPVGTTELTATVTVTNQGWGTQIDMDCTYEADNSAPDGDEPGDKLAMEVVGRDGRHDRLATWTALSGSSATPGASTSMPMDQIATVEIVSADTGSVLLQRTL